MVDQVKSENNCSLLAAVEQVADELEINANSLYTTYLRAKKPTGKKHGNQIFSDQTEKKLCGLILAFSSSGMALPQYIFLAFVRKMFNKPADWKGTKWFASFTRRHSAYLTYSKAKGLDIQRVNHVTKEVVHGFITAYKFVTEMYKLDADFIINADESPCEISKSNQDKILKSAKAATQGTVNLPKSMLRTILPFVAASGRVWMVVLIYKTINDTEGGAKVDVSAPSTIKRTRGTYPTYYATTSKGFITNELWTNIIATFIELIRAAAGTKHAMLLLDRHSVHLEMTSLQSLINNSIHPLYLPAHTTHIIQPLDDVILGGLKRKMRQQKSYEVLRRFLLGEEMNTIIQEIFTDLGSNAFEPDMIKAGFANTGIYPFNETEILKKFENEYMWTEKSTVAPPEELPVETIADQFKEFLMSKTSNNSRRKVTVSEKSKVFTGEDILDLLTLQAKEKEEKEHEKEEKRLQREENKLKKDEEKKQKQEKREQLRLEREELVKSKMARRNAMTCVSCQRVCRKEQNLKVCVTCKSFKLCQQCQKDEVLFEDHIDGCEPIAED